jgi:hypothetical protein
MAVDEALCMPSTSALAPALAPRPVNAALRMMNVWESPYCDVVLLPGRCVTTCRASKPTADRNKGAVHPETCPLKLGGHCMDAGDFDL